MTYLLLGIGALVLSLFLARAFVGADPKRLAGTVRKLGGWALIAAAGILALRGGFIVAIPLAMAGMALLGRGLPLGFPFPGGNTYKSAGQQSRVRTTFLEMLLDHDTGRMDGRIVQGRLSGRLLSEIGLADLIALWAEWRAQDTQSGQLLEAYLDRRDPDWRAAAGADPGAGASSGGADTGARSSGRGPMGLDEAYEILGLRAGATESDIRRAHRALMKRLHPDQGGSTYLAAKLNEAKDVLLKGRA